MKHWSFFLMALIIVFAMSSIFGYQGPVNTAMAASAQDAKTKTNPQAEPKKDVKVTRSFTVEFLYDRAKRASKLYDEASSKGEGWWQTTEGTLTNLKKVYDLWTAKTNEYLKDRPLSLEDKVLSDLIMTETQSITEVVDSWLKVAPNRPQSRFASDIEKFTDDFQWHKPSFEPKRDGGAEEAAKAILEYTIRLEERWGAYREANNPKANGTTEVINVTGMLGWSIVKKGHNDRIYRDGEALWKTHVKVTAIMEDFLKTHGGSLKEETKKAFEDRLKGVKGCAEEFGKLYNPPKEEAKK